MDMAVCGEQQRALIVVAGELDIATAAQVRASAMHAVAEGVAFDIDASAVTFVDAAGLRALHELQLRAGGQLRLVARSPELDRLLSLAGLRELF